MTLLAAVLLTVWDFSVSEQQVEHGGVTDQWAWGMATGAPTSDPVWSTQPSGEYLHDTVDWLALDVGDLDRRNSPILPADLRRSVETRHLERYRFACSCHPATCCRRRHQLATWSLL